ncbi:MAG: hypothetical protein KKA55_07885 [Proteobacteria bacterium]|nr:hypothetical protein [Pseudomonadota bacterium]MBU1595438.1 hypothetical protein [Pseudomonadota bacterium]
MLKVTPLTLPEKYPADSAIKSSGDNRHGYEPEFWEFFYDLNRYLEHVPQNTLSVRYLDICKNLQCLTSEDRHIIPRQSFLSSWYWFIKEHQTRYEFYLRKEELPCSPPNAPIYRCHAGSPMKPASPNAADILFRFCEPVFIDSLIQRGNLRVKAASEFRKCEGDEARNDDELVKVGFITGDRLKVTLQDGSSIPIIGNMKRTAASDDFYMFCLSCEWDKVLVDELGGACAVIKDVGEFAKRLNCAALEVLDGWLIFHSPVEYYDPYDTHLSRKIISPIFKDFRFAYQREYRFLWQHMGGAEAVGHFDLDIGCLEDIAERI